MAEKQEPTQLDRIEKSVDILAKTLLPLPDKVDRLEKKVDGIGSELKGFRAETEANFAEVNDRLDTLETTVRRHDAKLDTGRRAA